MNIIDLLVALPEQGILPWIRLVFIVISALMGVGIIWLLFVSSWFEEHYGAPLADVFSAIQRRFGIMRMRWRRIRSRLESDEEEQWQLAIIEAEEFLDSYLERRGLRGGTLLERLEQAEDAGLTKEELQGISDAFHTTEQVIHDPDAHITQKQARSVLDKYEAVLHKLSTI